MVMVKASEGNPDSGDFVTEECDAILVIEEYRDLSNDSQNPRIEIDVVIDSATVATQIGKKIKKAKNSPSGGERFSLVHVPNRITEFACAVGIYNTVQWRKDKEAGVNPDLPFETTIGMMFASPIRHKRWDEKRDPAYWQGELEKATAEADAGGEGADKAAQKAKRCQRILQEKRGNLQIGGESGFTFWGIGDAEADHIPLTEATAAILAANFPNGLPTKSGTLRKRGAAATAPAGNGAKAPAKAPAGGTARNPNPPANPPAGQTSKPAAAPAGAGMGSSLI